jgi:23S rRNA (adenine2503-C2)-methyltransferase
VRRISGSGPGGLGRAEVTVSTVGIVPGIAELAASGLRASLAVSLHAPDNATRARLLPAGRHFGVAEIMGAADRYQADTGRIVNIQYCLLAGVNDSPEQARELAALMVGRRMHVNLLHYNPTGPGLSGTPYTPSSDEAVAAFQSVLRDHGVVTHRRQPRGRTIDAACGQLRRRAG